MARVLPGAPRLAADCFCRQRLGGYGSRRRWLLASQSADDMALIRVAGFDYTEQAMSRWTNSLS